MSIRIGFSWWTKKTDPSGNGGVMFLVLVVGHILSSTGLRIQRIEVSNDLRCLHQNIFIVECAKMDAKVCAICLSPYERLVQNRSYLLRSSISTIKDTHGWKILCGHIFCIACIRNWIRHNYVTFPLQCPITSCKTVVLPEHISLLFPPNDTSFQRYNELVLRSRGAIYCPNKKCSVLIQTIPASCHSSCPKCRHSICNQCEVEWHEGFTCEAYQALPETERGAEDLQLLKLAKQNRWQQCPKCRGIIERTSGCDHMQCRCGTAFDYSNGNVLK